MNNQVFKEMEMYCRDNAKDIVYGAMKVENISQFSPLEQEYNKSEVTIRDGIYLAIEAEIISQLTACGFNEDIISDFTCNGTLLELVGLE